MLKWYIKQKYVSKINAINLYLFFNVATRTFSVTYIALVYGLIIFLETKFLWRNSVVNTKRHDQNVNCSIV